MEQKIGKLKGTAYTREMYLFRKNYPIRWWLRRLFKKLIKLV